MTAALAQQTVPVKNPASVRKRRRRVAPGGAADDCFTCSKRNIKCDRRRPYCSQCLEIGNECSGYKTQLTWGVGVASRGKLRGLSLPVAQAPPVAKEQPSSSVKAASRSRSSTTSAATRPSAMPSPWAAGHHHEPRHFVGASAIPSCGPGPIDIPAAVSQAASAPATPYGMPGFDYIGLSHQHDQPTHLPQVSWAALQYSPDVDPKYKQFPLALVTDDLPSSMDSVGSDIDYLSPMSQSYTRDDLPFSIHSPPSFYDGAGFTTPGPSIGGHGNGNGGGGTHPQQPRHHQSSNTATTTTNNNNNVHSNKNSSTSTSHDGSSHRRSSMSPGSPHPLFLDQGQHHQHQQQAPPASCPSLIYAPSEISSSLHSHMDPFEQPHQLGQKMMREFDGLSAPHPGTALIGGGCTTAGLMWPASTLPDEEDGAVRSPLLLQEPAQARWPVDSYAGHARSNSGRLQAAAPQEILTSRMAFFVEYYKTMICPSMVFIDGPDNPYREHILQLATDSRSLQHSICALAACNLRMRRKLSLVPASEQQQQAAAESLPDDSSLSEEHQHRNLAVHLLNQQLNDADKSTDDSVLATILLLCHYRMVDSGVAKFQTQFAGVKKILAMRAARRPAAAPSADSAWMEALFTYFDCISASINDREAQLVAPLFSGSAAGAAPGAGIENLVGCDGELFKIISRLGRLNMLSQRRPVQGGAGDPDGPGSAHSSPGGIDNGNMDMDTATAGDDLCLNRDCSEDDSAGLLFWREWKQVRMALQQWQFDADRVASSLPGSPQPAAVQDLRWLSETFRYASLLYTQRLAAPQLPSVHADFQGLVGQVMYYVAALEGGRSVEKFLLWPLFVAGSECVDELQQDVVRSRCREIMARSGYMNNLTALNLLEKIWAGEPGPLRDSCGTLNGGAGLGGVAALAPAGRGPFPWNRCIGGPGIGVEWIMF